MGLVLLAIFLTHYTGGQGISLLSILVRKLYNMIMFVLGVCRAHK